MGNIVTRFTERFGCKHPFACAGMAFAGMTPDLELAGQGIGLIHDIPSATSAVERMMAEAGDILARLSDAIRR
jgi:NAD(P)H-dependent flavin oxidoreductase YrpB (nitropropane dioxygenase family)